MISEREWSDHLNAKGYSMIPRPAASPGHLLPLNSLVREYSVSGRRKQDMIRDGSFAAKAVLPNIRKNGATVWQDIVSNSVANDKSDYLTQPRDTDTFAAGDLLQIHIEPDGEPGCTTTLNEIVVVLEVYFDT